MKRPEEGRAVVVVKHTNIIRTYRKMERGGEQIMGCNNTCLDRASTRVAICVQLE